jgi:hypothetical protein
MRRVIEMVGSFLLLMNCAGSLEAQGQAWRFMVFGDTRGTSSSDQINTNTLAELACEATNQRPAFVLVPGDLVYSGSLTAFQTWSNIMAPVYQAGISVYPVRGSHDLEDSGAFGSFFSSNLPKNGPSAELGLTYAVIYSNTLIMALDNYVAPHQVNTNWIMAVLQTNPCLHVFAMAHEPAFKAYHADCLDDVPTARDTFWQLLSNAACRAYFCGHDHFYDHTRLEAQDGDASNDVHQYIVGTGGAPFFEGATYDGVNDSWIPTRVLHEDNLYGYVVVEIDGYNAALTWFHRTGPNAYEATSDVFKYSLAATLTSTYRDGAFTLSWSGGGWLQSAPSISGPWTAVANAASPYVITYPTDPATFYRVRLR